MENREGSSEYIGQRDRPYNYEIEDTHAHDSIAFNVAADKEGVEKFVIDTFLKIYSEQAKKRGMSEPDLKNEAINIADDIHTNFDYVFNQEEYYSYHEIRVLINPTEESEPYRILFIDNGGSLNELGGIDKITREILQSEK